LQVSLLTATSGFCFGGKGFEKHELACLLVVTEDGMFSSFATIIALYVVLQVWPIKLPPAGWAYVQKRMQHFLKVLGMAFATYIQVSGNSGSCCSTQPAESLTAQKKVCPL
jgi:hypothetical protein